MDPSQPQHSNEPQGAQNAPERQNLDDSVSQAPLTEKVTKNDTTQPTAVSKLDQASTTMDKASAEKHSGETWDDFLFSKRIGKGGMGEVYLAHQKSLGRQVAVKVLARDLVNNEVFLKRFHLEARAVAQISHPNVIQIFAAGEHQDNHYFVMEYVEGMDLSERLKSGFKPSVKESLDLITQATAGLSAAHEKGLIHRDIKPGNMMLSNDGILKVMDFGIVRLQNEQQGLTMTGMIMGTAAYLSPEQGQGVHCDIRTDIYALGVVFYELLTKRVPFTGNNLTAVVYHHMNTAPRPLREIDTKIPEDFQAVVLKCLEKDPADRYATPLQLLADLRALADGTALSITGEELRRLRKGRTLAVIDTAPQKSRMTSVLLVCSLLLLIGGGIIAALFWTQLSAWPPLAKLLQNTTEQPVTSSPSIPPDPTVTQVESDPDKTPSANPNSPSVAPTEPPQSDNAQGENQALPPPIVDGNKAAEDKRLAAIAAAEKLAKLIEKAQAIAEQAVEDDSAYASLQLLAEEHADTKEIGPILDRTTSQRKIIRATKLNEALEKAQRHLAMGEFDLAASNFTEALAFDAQNALAKEGLKSVALWRQRRAKSAVLLQRFNELIAQEDLAQGQLILAELQQHDPTYPPLAEAIAQETQLIATLETRKRQAAEQAAALAKAQAAAELAQRISQASEQAQQAIEAEPWGPAATQAGETAIQYLADLDPDHAALASLRRNLHQRNAVFAAQTFLRDLDKVLATGQSQKLPALIADKDYLNALIELSEDEAFIFTHRLVAAQTTQDGKLNGVEVEITHALSMMPELRLNYIYSLDKQNNSWHIRQATTNGN